MNENGLEAKDVELIEKIKEDLRLEQSLTGTAILGAYYQNIENLIRSAYNAGFERGIKSVVENIEKYSLWKKND